MTSKRLKNYIPIKGINSFRICKKNQFAKPGTESEGTELNFESEAMSFKSELRESNLELAWIKETISNLENSIIVLQQEIEILKSFSIGKKDPNSFKRESLLEKLFSFFSQN